MEAGASTETSTAAPTEALTETALAVMVEGCSEHAGAATACQAADDSAVPYADDDGTSSGAGQEADEFTCAICLSQPAPVDLAVIKGCEHNYCAPCILHWAMYKETPLCPQCKCPFHYLYVHRQLDGTLSDYPVEESVCLLKRAQWFTDHVKFLDKARPLGSTSVFDPSSDLAANDYDEDDFYEDEIEQYYFSSAAGRARVILGNRRFGENGVLRGGRRYARPLPNQNNAAAAASSSSSSAPASKKSRGKGKAPPPGAGAAAPDGSSGAGGGASSSGAAVAAVGLPAPVAGGSGVAVSEAGVEVQVAKPVHGTPISPEAVQGSGGSQRNAGGGAGAGAAGSKSAAGQSRRAQRSARRTAADYEDAYLDEF